MEEINIKDLFTLFWNKKVEIVLITLFFMMAGVIYSYFFVTPEYTASTTLVLVQTSSKADSSGITSTDITINSKLVGTYSELIKTNAILGKVVDNLGIDKSEIATIKKKISVNSVEDTEVIKINVKNTDPNKATKIANEIATVFSEKIVEIYNISNIYLLDRAETPTTPSNINHTRDIIIFAFAGVVLSLLYIFAANMFDHTIKTEQDIEAVSGLPVLTTIPNYALEVKGGKR